MLKKQRILDLLSYVLTKFFKIWLARIRSLGYVFSIYLSYLIFGIEIWVIEIYLVFGIWLLEFEAQDHSLVGR